MVCSYCCHSKEEYRSHIELASVVDWGEVFVKVTYNLEGDGPLGFTYYEEVQKVVSVVRVGHTPNAEGVIRPISTQTSTQQRLHVLKAVCKEHLSILNIS